MPLLETRGAASAKGFGFTAGGKRIVDWTPYILIPNKPSVTPSTVAYPTRVSFFNKDTGTIDFNVSITTGYSQGMKLMRVGDWLYTWFDVGTNAIYYFNIINNTFGGVVNLTPSGAGNCDVAVIGNNNNPVLPAKVVSAGRDAAGTLLATRWTHNNDTGGFTVDTTLASAGEFSTASSSGESYSSPQIAPMGTMNNGVWTYGSFIGYCGFDDYPVPTTYTRYLVIYAPYTGSMSVLNSNLTTNNFSRPSGATLDYDYSNGRSRALLGTLDNQIFRLANSIGGFSQVNSVANNVYGNGYAPAAMVQGASGRLAIALRWSTSGSDNLRDIWLINESGAPTLLYQAYTFGYTSWLTSVIQMGLSSTQSVWCTSSYDFGGTNYVQIFVFSSSAGLTNLYPNISAFVGCLVDGFNATSRIVNYGA
jgi:hypothetical protein